MDRPNIAGKTFESFCSIISFGGDDARIFRGWTEAAALIRKKLFKIVF